MSLVLKNELINCVNKAMTATNHAAAELDRVRRMYQMTDEGIAEQSRILFDEARETADACKARGLAAIETACAALDKMEKDEGERRAADLGYMERLDKKLHIAAQMGEIKEDDTSIRERLKILFSEFTGDPLAISVIKQSLGERKTLYFLPEDTTGTRQAHIRTRVKQLFERAMQVSGCDPANFTDADRRTAEVNGFIDYCKRQADDFSRPDREVWDEQRANRAESDPVPAAFDMYMMQNA